MLTLRIAAIIVLFLLDAGAVITIRIGQMAYTEGCGFKWSFWGLMMPGAACFMVLTIAMLHLILL